MGTTTITQEHVPPASFNNINNHFRRLQNAFVDYLEIYHVLFFNVFSALVISGKNS